MENFERAKAMQKLYKQMIVEKVIEKRERGEQLKRNLSKIQVKLQQQSINKFKAEAAKKDEQYQEIMQKEKKRREDEAFSKM